MQDPLIILKKYWKHEQFRPLQREIISSVVKGQDTLALLPTGGGKSICFQLPALMREGLCIVISPLIALMKDQVEGLRKRGIHAIAVHSGMSRAEIDTQLNNCIYGSVKFLYVSPERLQTEIFRERVRQMKVSLLAVDEAHCISQWGYDFRPPYLQIADLREFHPQLQIVALTATATVVVKDDIINKLKFRQSFEIFQRTFARDNLSFVIRKAENKNRKLLEVLQKVQGSVIIYLRSRKATQELADWMTKMKISATYYHAGLNFEERSKRQEEWIHNKKRVMVATNAFGMGIDKPDVRIVIHLDLPENLEAYYQEAGRAGRDGQRSYAAIIYHDSDVSALIAKVNQSQPEVSFLKRVYQCLANYYQLAEGSSEGESFDFDIHDFAERFNLQMMDVFNALKKLEEEGLIEFNESFYSPSLLHLQMERDQLYAFQVASARFDPLIKMLLRLYGGQLDSDFVKISEAYLAKAMKLPLKELKAMLRHLHELKVVVYQPMKDTPQVTFVMPRQDADRLPVNHQRLEQRKALIESKMKAMTEFVTSSHRCRMQLIQDYFGEEAWETCGKCDVCVARKKKENAAETKELRQEIIRIITATSLSSEQLEQKVNPKDVEVFIDVIRELVDEGKLEYDEVWKLKIKR